MINLIKQGNSLVITSSQDFPFEAGKIVVPQNSLTYTIDESDIVCFRSVSNYDILFTGLLKDITINGTQATKNNLIQLFDAVGNAPTGGADPEHSVTSVNGQVGDVVFTGGEGISIDGTEISLTYKYSLFEIVDALPTENIDDNKIYLLLDVKVGENNKYVEYIHTPQGWETIGEYTPEINIDNYYTKEEINNKHFLTKIVLTQSEYDNLPTKDPDVIYIISDAPEVQEKLVSGQNIKTINNIDILGEGNIEIQGGAVNSVNGQVGDVTITAEGLGALTTIPENYVTDEKLNQKNYATKDEIIDNVFDATPLYTAYLSESKEVTPEFKDAILAAIPEKKVMVIHTSGNTATSDNNMVVNAASSELLTEFTGIFNDNLVSFELDKNTNKVDMVVTPIGGGKTTKYINDEGASIFDLTSASSNAQIKTAFTSTDGIKIPEVGDEIIVNDIDNNIVNSGIVVSKTKNNDDYEIIIHSNNIVSGFISIDSMTVYFLESQGVDSLRIKRAEHSSINPALITEEAISALTGQVQNASKTVEITQSEYDNLPAKDPKTLYVISDAPEINVNDFATQTWVTEQINAAIAGVEAKITEINNKI